MLLNQRPEIGFKLFGSIGNISVLSEFGNLVFFHGRAEQVGKNPVTLLKRFYNILHIIFK